MKAFWLGLTILATVTAVHAQTDGGLVPLIIEANKSLPDNNPNTSLGSTNLSLSTEDSNVDSPFNLDDMLKNPIKMLPERELVNPGKDMKINPRLDVEEKFKGQARYFGDSYLGEVKSSGKFVGVVCRDHEYVDGDRVKISANGHVVDHNMMLTSAFKGVNIELKPGFNHITFEALNEGSSSPNTAQIDVYDDKGQLIYSNKWNLSEGAIANMVVVKE
jgi:hypothetical protein